MKAGNNFIHNGKTYNCVGLDGGMVWGVENENDESQPFKPSECTFLDSGNEKVNDLINQIKTRAEQPMVTANFGDKWKEYAAKELPTEKIIDIAWKQGRTAQLLERALIEALTQTK